jgi:hypothetical protein
MAKKVMVVDGSNCSLQQLAQYPDVTSSDSSATVSSSTDATTGKTTYDIKIPAVAATKVTTVDSPDGSANITEGVGANGGKVFHVAIPAVTTSKPSTVKSSDSSVTVSQGTNANGGMEFDLAVPAVAASKPTTVGSPDSSVTVTETTNANGGKLFNLSVPAVAASKPTTVASPDSSVTVTETTNANGGKLFNLSVSAASVPDCDKPAALRPVIAPVPPNPNPNEKSKYSSADYGGGDIFSTVFNETNDRASLEAMGMRPCDNAVRMEFRLSHEYDGGAFASPFTAVTTTGITARGITTTDEVKRTSYSRANAENMTAGVYTLKVGTGGFTAEFTGSISGMPAGTCNQVWACDILEFLQVA